MLTWTNLGISLVLAAVIPEIVLFYMNRFKKHSKPNSEHLNEVMFFTDKGFACKEHCYKRVICEVESCSYRNISYLIQLLEEATVSLDICIYMFTCHALSEAIIRIHRKGVKVRVIADADMTQSSGAQIGTLRKYGIPVRMKKSPYLMHHKFAVINDLILVNGSCNWTMQALTGNWDNIIVTSVPDLVIPFSQHFSQMWKEFSEIDYTFQV